MEHLRWPTAPDQHQLQSLGVSWVELVVSFMLFTGTYFPVKRKDSKGQEHLHVMPTEAVAHAYAARLGEMSKTFSLFVRQTQDLCSGQLLPEPLERALIRSLFAQGSDIYSQGFVWRPCFYKMDQVALLLKPYLVYNKGPAYNQLPKMDLSQPPELLRCMNEEYQIDWQKSCARFSKGVREIKAWKKTPQRRLSFL